MNSSRSGISCLFLVCFLVWGLIAMWPGQGNLNAEDNLSPSDPAQGNVAATQPQATVKKDSPVPPGFTESSQRRFSFDRPILAMTTDALTTHPDIYGCACGCSVFNVGDYAMLAQRKSGMVWFEYDFQNQNQNWHHSSSASAADNNDKIIRTDFFNVGFQYIFDQKWGVKIQVPFYRRYFETIDEDTGSLASTTWIALSDIQLRGIYTGFTDDQSIGVDFGIRLPTGDYTHPLADRDTEIGTGSTDLLLGGYYRAPFAKDQPWAPFLQIEADIPVLITDKYRPGYEFDEAAGINYTGFWIQKLNIVPLAQVIMSERSSDSGANSADPVATGYTRLLLSPGIEFDAQPVKVHLDAEFPIYQHVIGDQIVAPVLFKSTISYNF